MSTNIVLFDFSKLVVIAQRLGLDLVVVGVRRQHALVDVDRIRRRRQVELFSK